MFAGASPRIPPAVTFAFKLLLWGIAAPPSGRFQLRPVCALPLGVSVGVSLGVSVSVSVGARVRRVVRGSAGVACLHVCLCVCAYTGVGFRRLGDLGFRV